MCYYPRMKNRRLTRQESRDLTRQQLLDAAEQLVAAQGLAATSLEDIANQAGFTRGAVYSNFSGKNDLFIALLRRDHERSVKDFASLFASNMDADALRQGIRELYGRIYRDERCFLNWAEARMLAIRDPAFRKEFAVLADETLQQTAGFVEAFYRAAGLPPPPSIRSLALGIMGLIEGVHLYLMSNHHVDLAEAEPALSLFIDALMEQVLRASGDH